MTKSNHTPLYLHALKDEDGSFWSIYDSATGTVFCDSLRGDEASLIVHRVNNWDKLVEALEAALPHIQNNFNFGARCMGEKENPFALDLALIEAALALAKEGK